MKYYSDITKKFYDNVEALESDEQAAKRMTESKGIKIKKLDDEIKAQIEINKKLSQAFSDAAEEFTNGLNKLEELKIKKRKIEGIPEEINFDDLIKLCLSDFKFLF
jgi:predicted RNase H-like nuclease (RuvC/YqgF family)